MEYGAAHIRAASRGGAATIPFHGRGAPFFLPQPVHWKTRFHVTYSFYR